MPEQKRPYVKRGAALVSEHKDRKVKSYLVFDLELEHISTLNGWTTIFISVGSFLLSLAVGLWSGIFVDSAPSDAAAKYGPVMENTFFALAAGCFVLAWRSMRGRKSAIRRIKDDHESAAQETGSDSA